MPVLLKLPAFIQAQFLTSLRCYNRYHVWCLLYINYYLKNSYFCTFSWKDTLFFCSETLFQKGCELYENSVKMIYIYLNLCIWQKSKKFTSFILHKHEKYSFLEELKFESAWNFNWDSLIMWSSHPTTSSIKEYVKYCFYDIVLQQTLSPYQVTL